MLSPGQVVWFAGQDDLRAVLAVFPTELGWMGCVWQCDLVDRLTFGHRSAAQVLDALCDGWERQARYEPTDEQRRLLDRLSAFAEGVEDDFQDVKLNLAPLTAFQRKVVGLCRRIRWGQTMSYGALATAAGRSGAARAVGTVMSRNRFPLIVPCHRVIGSQGALGGFSAPDGIKTKSRLLERESSGQRRSRMHAEIVGG